MERDEPARLLAEVGRFSDDRGDVAWIGAYGTTPDGRYVSAEVESQQGSDLWLFPLDPEEAPVPLLATEHHGIFPAISPDGRWLAYTSNKSGRFEVYVRTFAEGGAETQVSVDGGEEPLWSRSGDRLFFRNGDLIQVAGITTEPDLRAGAPDVMYQGDFHNSAGLSYDVLPGGERFVVNRPVAAGKAPTEIRVIVGFLEELERLVPSG